MTQNQQYLQQKNMMNPYANADHPNAQNLDPATGTVLEAGGQLLGGIINNRWAKQAATKAYERQVEFWNMQNAYNDPSAFMARLKKAGINPHSFYSKGATQVQSSPPSVQQAKTFGISPRILEAIALKTNLENTASQTAKNYSDAQLNQNRADNLDAQTNLTGKQVLGKQIENEILSVKRDFANTREYQELKRIESQINNLDQLTATSKSARALNVARSKMEYLRMQEQRVINRYADRITSVRLDNAKLTRDYQEIINQYAQDGIDFKRDTLATRQIWKALRKYGYDEYTTEALLLKEGFDYVITQAKDLVGLGSKMKAAQRLGTKLKSKTVTDWTGRQKKTRIEDYNYQ